VANFVNDPVHPAQLPRLAHDDFVSVDPNWLRVSLMSMAAFAAVVTAAGVVVSVVMSSRNTDNSWLPLAVAAGLVVLTAVAAVLRTIEVRNIAYQIRTHDISYRSGVLVRRVETVPYVRVQHARIRQGPVQRRFAIATLEVNSAGPDLKIHGLPATTAEQLKALVVDRAGDLDESQ